MFKASRAAPLVPLRNPEPPPAASPANGEKVFPEKSKTSLVEAAGPNKDQKKREIIRKKKRSWVSEERDQSCADDVGDFSHNKAVPVDPALEDGGCRDTPDIWELLSLSWPLPAPLSPLPPDEPVIIYKSYSQYLHQMSAYNMLGTHM